MEEIKELIVSNSLSSYAVCKTNDTLKMLSLTSFVANKKLSTFDLVHVKAEEIKIQIPEVQIEVSLANFRVE